jgi:hypothetical protein
MSREFATALTWSARRSSQAWASWKSSLTPRSAHTGYRSGCSQWQATITRVRGTKINSSDPPLTAVCTAYPTPPFPPFLHPPIELASFGPSGRLHLDRRVDFSAICFSTLLHVVVAEIQI